MQLVGGPTPLAPPKKEGRVTDAETARAIDEKTLPEPGSPKPTDET